MNKQSDIGDSGCRRACCCW